MARRKTKQPPKKNIGPPVSAAVDPCQAPPPAHANVALRNATFALGLAAVVGFYLLLKMFGLNAYAGDEHIYLYQARLVAEGQTPYTDFAMAHPPLQTLVHAALFGAFGYGFTLARLLPVAWCLAAGLFLALLVRRELGRLAAVVAVGLFLLAHETLRSSTHATGVNATMAFVMAALLAHRRDAVIATAALCTAAVLTRFYAAPAVLVLVAHALLKNPRQGLRLVGWGAALGALSFLALGLWTGFAPMWSNLFVYHASKTAMEDGSLANMRDTVLFHNATLASAFAVGVLVLLVDLAQSARRRSGRGWFRLRQAAAERGLALPLLCAVGVAVYLWLLANMDRVWMYYFVPAFPFAAVVGGFLARRAVSPLGAGPRWRALVARTLVGAMLVGLVLAAPRLEARLDYWQEEMAKPEAERVRTYAWRDGALPSWLNALVRDTLWQDQRVVGERAFFWNYLLWHESRVLDNVDEAVAAVREHTTASGELFGDSGTVPLLALLSGRRIAANEVDTNIQRYRSGVADPAALLRAIDKPSTELIVLRPRFGVAGLAQVETLVRNKYQRVAVSKSAQGMTLVFFKRRDSGR